MTNTLDIVTASLAMPEEACYGVYDSFYSASSFLFFRVGACATRLKARRRCDGLRLVRGLQLKIFVGDLFIDLDIGIFREPIVARLSFNEFLLHGDAARIVDPELDVGEHLAPLLALGH